MVSSSDAYPVTVPFGRIVAVARALGTQDCDFCPPGKNRVCFNQRNIGRYIQGVDPVDYECTECHIRWILNGD